MRGSKRFTAFPEPNSEERHGEPPDNNTLKKARNQMDNMEQRVRKIVAEQLGVNEAEIKNESSFVDDLGADSLDTVELVMALEEESGTEIPDEDAEKITTVQQAIDYVTSRKKA